jgi:hypothetical protein
MRMNFWILMPESNLIAGVDINCFTKGHRLEKNGKNSVKINIMIVNICRETVFKFNMNNAKFYIQQSCH